jgi:hypothetical protein
MKTREEVSTCLNFIVGALYGFVNRPKLKSIGVTLTKVKEDVEASIRYFKQDGVVVRFNRVGFATKYYGCTGGTGTFEARLKPSLEASRALKKAFPQYGDIWTRKNGMTEFRLKKLKAPA